ncbi:hypothetical protein CR970_04490 [Candidatus Saccharibacteria bacterium]|nr:MAG: hypothetical protein CR970_04490 [Candidatus Saccharibacteria bacterium]
MHATKIHTAKGATKRATPAKGSKSSPAHRPANSLFDRVRDFIMTHHKEVILVVVLLLVSGLSHGWNMLHYPYIENDEATYTSRAWAFTHEGDLDVYTYRYDHAPVGWMFIGLWHLLTGGTALFGSYITSGRVLMLLLHLGSAFLLYVLTKRITNGNKLAASVAVIIFSLSPLALYFQRRILLDNIMTFWVLMSLVLATQPHHKLKSYFWSGILFGVAVLTKLNAIFFAPAYLYIIWSRAHKAHRIHAVLYWCFVAGSIIGAFFLYALLKGELFQAPLDASGNPTHVSVVETFKLQLSRGDFAWPWQADSSLRQNINSWILKDWFVLLGGAFATLALTVVAFVTRKKYIYLPGLVILLWAYLAFLGRGKLVIDLYIVPFIPFLAAAVGVCIGLLGDLLKGNKTLRKEFYLLLACAAILIGFTLPYRQYIGNETSNQQQAITWIEQNVPKDAIIAADNYVYPYLALEKGYTNVSYFFSTEYDPEVRKSYQDDWRNVEYLVLTHEVVEQIKTGTVPKMRKLLDHAVLMADYRENTSSYLDLPKYISTNGDWVQVYKIKPRVDIVLQDSWQYFKTNFIVDYGQVIEPANNGLTTSQGQASAMLRAVEQDDEPTFQGVWQWSKDHIRYRNNDVLLSWKWEKGEDGTYTLGDTNNVCGADQVIAYSLFRAADKWPSSTYEAEARKHVSDWWSKCVFSAGGRLYVDSSADGSRDMRLIDPADFRPAMYRYLATKVPDLPWSQLIDDGYATTNALVSLFGTVPTWANVSAGGRISSAAGIMGSGANDFSYDSMQLIRNLAIDNQLHNDPRPAEILRRLAPSVESLGIALDNAPAYMVAYLFYLQVVDPSSAIINRVYDDTIHASYESETGKWQDGDYYNQVWFWQWHALQSQLPVESRYEIK